MLFRKKHDEDLSDDITILTDEFTDELTDEEPPKKKKLPGWVIIPVIAVILLSAFAAQKLLGSSSGQNFTELQVEKASIDSVQEVYNTSGTVESEKIKTYYSPVNAPVTNCNAVVGNTVKSGDLLITYDTKDLERNNQESQLNLQASQASRQASIDQANKAVEAENAANAKLADTANKLADEVNALADQVDAAAAQWQQNQQDADTQITENSQQRTSLNTKIAQLEQTIYSCEITISSVESGYSGRRPDYNAALAVPENQRTEEEKLLIEAFESYDKATADLSQAQKDLKEAQDTLNAIQDPEVNDAGYADLKAQYDAKYAEWQAAYEAATNTTPSASGLSGAELKSMEISEDLAELAALTPAELVAKGKEGIKADMDGVIASVEISAGTSAVQGSPLFTIASNKDVKVDIEISPDDYGKFKTGTAVVVKVGDKEYDGTLSKINKIATKNEKGNPVIGAEVHVNNPDEELCIGATAKITMIIARSDNVLTVPAQAVNTSSDGDFVYVIENNIVRKKSVETGTASTDKIEILSGLEEGDQVVTDLNVEITEGMAAAPAGGTASESAENEE